ncbi:MAG: hypothetical protein ABSE92_14765 [Terriglobales bacterium]|jgi:hypothetical protein
MTTPAQAPYPNQKPDTSATTTISPKGGRASTAGRSDDNKFDIHIESAERSPLKKVAGIFVALLLLGGAYYAWRGNMARPSAKPTEAAANSTTGSNAADLSLPAPSALPAAQADVQVVHGLVKIADSQVFAIEVPPHAVHPHVHGEFHTVGSTAPAVDLLLMDQQQYDDFSHHSPLDWMQGQEGTKSADVDWPLHPTAGEAQKYYLVFATSQHGGSATVKADFVVGLE